MKNIYNCNCCADCENRAGNHCLYDMKLEAEEIGEPLEYLVGENHCQYYEPSHTIYENWED